MRKIIFVFLFLFSFSAFCSQKPTVTVFYSPNCKVCIKTKEEILTHFVIKYQDKINWEYLNISDNKENLAKLISISQQFKKENAYVPSILVGDTFLVGYDEIKANLDKALKNALNANFKLISKSTDILEIFKNFSLFTILGSGLADGINPCAFAVIVFFVSFLAVYGYSRKKIILIGSFYCFAVFLTYLLIGLGFFNFLYTIKNIYLAIKIFYYLVAFVCFVFAGFSFYDSIKFKKEKDVETITLQLPKFLKKKINVVIGSQLRQTNKDALNLAISSFIIGCLVSILEAACTGQVYLPTIVFILKYTPYKLKAFAYLLLYNLAFIFPLIVIFIVSLIGFGSQRLNNFLKKHLSLFKIILAIVFLLLGVFIILDEIKTALIYYIDFLKNLK
ncbi:MAG: hypothetical protein NC925_05135 [Candidatus Omnitrophica bacterium]|nr:hypothetical protein [Candidatus Omnitrophota bacterium]MCM8832048.1 hypothetical protein [Candidatus Omnitrophota bacterium]